jgi:hypothetical protein
LRLSPTARSLANLRFGNFSHRRRLSPKALAMPTEIPQSQSTMTQIELRGHYQIVKDQINTQGGTSGESRILAKQDVPSTGST